MNSEGLQKVGMAVLGIWAFGWLFLGWEPLWPIYMVLNLFSSIFSFPPFSWLWGWFYKGAPLVHQDQPAQELQLPQNQLDAYIETYVQHYGDAALIFATHDGYPQIVKGLLYNDDLGYRDLVDARDDSGNTALIYAAAKGFRQCTAALLRGGADPDAANQGGGSRTPLMEAAGGGHKDIVMALRLTPNITIDQTDDYGNTALHYAAYHGHLAVALELLKSNPNRELKNIYGHTPASYALTQKHKAVADVLSRPESRSQRLAREEEEKQSKMGKDIETALWEQLAKMKEKKEEKHVKGTAEELHKKEDFAPKLEPTDRISEAEEKALEEQLHKMRRAHEEAELRSQKKIVELLEKNAATQQSLDKLQEMHRAIELNHTELKFKLAELDVKHRSSELKAQEEAEKAASLASQHKQAQMELELHKSRVELAERERDQHLEASKRHQETAQRMQEEAGHHMTKMEEQHKEMVQIKERLSKADEQRRKHEEEIARLKAELQKLNGGSSEGSTPAGVASPKQDAAPEKPVDTPPETKSAAEPNQATESEGSVKSPPATEEVPASAAAGGA